jgi:hypothetical protein
VKPSAGRDTLPRMAAVFNLNHYAHYVHWHFFEMSVSNIVVIAAVLLLFVLAILLPFPGGTGATRKDADRS